jgi:hypothetical protein
MSGIGKMFSDTIQSVTGKTPQQHADALKSALPSPAKAAMSDNNSASALGAPKEGAGKTMTGGRKHKKRGGRKKTHKKPRGGKKSYY